jgi:hypothetical protein
MRLLKFALSRLRSESGQALVLAALAMVVILGFAALSIDVGYWYSQKREVQKAVDAAALAGAMELPDDYVMAETVAREYLTKNGVVDTDTISVTFRCTSTYEQACDPAVNRWDSIIVEVERPAEAWFARVFGIQEALIRDVRAVGCHGLCGGAPAVPVDVVQVIDRSGSMSGSDMDNVKNGVRALLEYFNGDIQRVGLGVLSGGKTSPPDPCDAPPVSPEPPAEDYAIVLPVSLSDDYQSSPGVLNEGSALVSTIDCLEDDGYTPIGPTMEAAVDELQANGRPDVTWGIILFGDGVANRPTGGDTGNRSPTANAAAPGGDDNGFQTNPTGAYADDSSYAQDPNSGTNTNTGCGDAGKDRHDFYNYGISVPVTNDVTGITVRLVARISSTTSTTTRRMCVELSWDGGATWTAAKQTSSLSTSYQTYTLGGSADTWGRTWTPSELSNANFRLRVTNVANRTDRTFYLDWAAVRVYHEAATGPCEYAADQADLAKSLGIEVFTIGYGLHDPDNPGGNYCTYDSGSWAGSSGWELLEYMATDQYHFFDEPSSADLEPIFRVIGSQLTGGSVLVE